MVPGVPVVWLSQPVMAVESERDRLPGVRVPPPWPYFITRASPPIDRRQLQKSVYVTTTLPTCQASGPNRLARHGVTQPRPITVKSAEHGREPA
jgi:hypothetical protein